MQHGDHAGDPAQPGAVQLVQGPACAAGQQIFLVGVAEWEEYAVGSCGFGELGGDVPADGAVVSGEQPVRHVEHRHVSRLPWGLTGPGG